MWGLSVSRVASCSAQLLHPVHSLQARCVSQSEFGVINIPVALQRRMKREKMKQKRKEREHLTQKSRMGNQNVPIITCRRNEFNHYEGQTYSRFAEVPLASKGWLHRKSAGDHFTIHSHASNPAFQHCKSGTEEEEDFASLGLDSDIVAQLHKMGLERPTNIQSLAIPQVLEGKNTLITAETGNGKTLAFIGPMLQQIKMRKAVMSDLPFNSPIGLVIVPGKELAAQIYGVASRIGKSLGIRVKLLTGGGTKKRMLSPPMSQVELLVASFGALSKLTTVGVYKMNYLTHITLDEADTLLDDSFNEQLTHYITKQPIQGAGDGEEPGALSGVQLTLVAATIPRGLSRTLEPIVDLDSVVNVSTPHVNCLMPHVSQRFFRVSNKTKVEKLVELVKSDAKRGSPVIIFSNKSKTSDWVSIFLNNNGVPCVNLNGAMSSDRRQDHYKAFMSGQVKALSCTDLTSRGLDTREVSHVINYEFPDYIADYIHRCGRTGRVGGASASLITSLVQLPWEVELLQKIEYAVRKGEEFYNVNANIKRIITSKVLKEEDKVLKAFGTA